MADWNWVLWVEYADGSKGIEYAGATQADCNELGVDGVEDGDWVDFWIEKYVE